ncbi:MAG TPA: MFS transporter [Anaerolineales bacterium]|nr:MFS transporter [Anaerolineales bacterium]
MTPASPKPFVRDGLTWLAYAMLAYVAYVQSTLGPLMPFLRDELELNYTRGGFLPAALALGIIACGLTSDRIARRWGRRSALWGGGAGVAASAVGLALSGQFLLTLLAALSLGFCSSLALIMIQAILSDQHGERRAIAFTEANVGASLSSTLAPLCIGGFQRAGVGWRSALYLAVLVLALAAARFRLQVVPDAQAGSLSAAGGRRAGLPLSFWLYWVVVCLVVSIEMCLIVWGADFLENVVGLSKVNAAMTIGVFLAAMVIGRWAGSRLTRVWPSTTLLLMALGIALVGFPVFWLSRLAALNILGLFVAGLGVANLYPLTLSIAVGLAPEQANTASAKISLGVGTALLTAPLLLGWLADRLSLQNAYGLVAVLLVIAIGVTSLNNRVFVRREAPARP